MQAPARRKRTGTGASRTPADVRSRPARETAARGADGAGAATNGVTESTVAPEL
jgi:hypothetical protein